MEEWKLPWAGGCRCGETRIEITLPPLLTAACHCTGCQKMSASAFSLSIAVPAEGFRLVAGAPELGGLRGEHRQYFCASCKAWAFTRPGGLDWLVNVRASMLDDHEWFVPFAEFWTSEGLEWAKTPARHSYPTEPEPEAIAALLEAYAREGARPGG